MSRGALVMGGGIDGVQAALDLADAGIEVTLVERSSSLYPLPGGWGDGHPQEQAMTLRFMPKLLEAARHGNIRILTDAEVVGVWGEKGDFRVTILQHPRYVSSEVCTSCGRCERECPVEVPLRPGEAQDGHKAIHLPGLGLKSVPSAYVVEKRGVPSCTAACPAGVNVQGYVALVSQGRFAEALDLITEAVPFARVLGRVCPRPCESECTRGEVDQPVAVCALKRFVADSSPSAPPPEEAVRLSGPPRVAIVGAGPAGLTAARELVRLGHRCTVFEALPVPGGMITVGMPRFRLPREVRQADIEAIVRWGVEIKTSTPIGKDLTLDDLRRRGYEAILLAVGAHKNQRLGILGEELSGVINSVALLQALNLKQPVSIGKEVVVIGGGYTAIDSARTAIRLHCDRVRILYRRTLEEMPADKEEVVEAMEEGVEVEYLVAPTRIIGEDGRVVGVECQRMTLGAAGSSGRRWPVPVPGSEFFIQADTVIVAVGQQPDLSFLDGDPALTDGGTTIVADPLTLATRVPGVFAAGDAASGLGTIIEAIATGRRAAVSIDRFLRGDDLRQGRSLDRVTPVEVNLEEVRVPQTQRHQMPCLPYEERVGNFEEVDLGFSAEMAVREAGRCLSCAICSECLACERACELKAIAHDANAEEIELEVGAIVAAGDPEIGESILCDRPGIYLTTPASQDGGLAQVLNWASAAAGRAMVDLAKNRGQVPRSWRMEQRSPRGGWAPRLSQPRVGVFVCGCGGSIGDVVNVPDVVSYSGKLPGVIYSGELGYACTEAAAAEIKRMAREHGLTHVVLAACSCCGLELICFSCSDRRVQCKANLLNASGLHDVCYEFVNIREHCAWVHRNAPEEATAKAKRLVGAGVARAREGEPPPWETRGVEESALVVGGGLGALQAASDLAAQGFPTLLVGHDGWVREESLQVGHARQRLEEEVARSGATVFEGARLVCVEGSAGSYEATIVHERRSIGIVAGAVVIDLSAGVEGLPPFLLRAFRDESQRLEPALSRLPGVFLCGTGPAAEDVADALVQGSAAASKASILLTRGEIDIEQTVATVEQRRCRGCGTCVSICECGAIALTEGPLGIPVAQVDEGLCRGCGICVAGCPAGALSQRSHSDRQITAALEAILS